ncbi:cupin domain-containing protein [Allorhizobium pseudoryzae]|uniref:cupin domain-containing protein n=1 Tax=Allorhizobium pseudoryzae TaxID=379684 RepID=UPI003D0101A1
MRLLKLLLVGGPIAFTSLATLAAAEGLPVVKEVRRVVVSEKADGTSFVASDGKVAGVDMQGVGSLFTMWGNDKAAVFPDDGAQPKTEGLYPPVGGFRVYLTTYPAGQIVKPAAEDLGSNAELKANKVPGMHKSDTTDFDIVLSGTVDCIMSDGSKVTLKAGDMIVLNGADHAWQNNGQEDAVIAFFMAGANRK